MIEDSKSVREGKSEPRGKWWSRLGADCESIINLSFYLISTQLSIWGARKFLSFLGLKALEHLAMSAELLVMASVM